MVCPPDEQSLLTAMQSCLQQKSFGSNDAKTQTQCKNTKCVLSELNELRTG